MIGMFVVDLHMFTDTCLYIKLFSYLPAKYFTSKTWRVKLNMQCGIIECCFIVQNYNI